MLAVGIMLVAAANEQYSMCGRLLAAILDGKLAIGNLATR